MKYLGVDWGLKTIGLATSEGEIASPLKSLTVTSFDDAIYKIDHVIKNEQVDILVIGKPEGEMGKIVDKVTSKLQKIGIEVIQTDETLSSKKALEVMIEQKVGKIKRREDHMIAASILLQQFLDQKL